MPKRKAPEVTDGEGAGAAGGGITSPNPRKKNKREALAAAKEWHDKRLKSGVRLSADKAGPTSGSKRATAQPGTTSPARTDEKGATNKKEALAAAKEWHDKRLKSGIRLSAVKAGPTSGSKRATAQPGTTSPARTDEKVATKTTATVSSSTQKLAPTQSVPYTIASRSPLFEEANSSKNNAGNAFLQSLRKGKRTAAATNNEVVSSELNGTLPSTAASVNGSTNSSFNITNNAPKNIGINQVIFVIFLVALNVAAVIYTVFDQRSSSNSFHLQYVSEVEKLTAELSKSLEVEAVLRSGIGVLEEELYTKRIGIKNISEVPSLYGIEMEQDVKLQSREEKGVWLERMRILEVTKHLSLDDLDATLVVDGKERIRALKDCIVEGEQSCDDHDV